VSEIISLDEDFGKRLDSLADLLDGFVVPVLCQTRHGKPELIGTGFYLYHEQKLYLITASHVIDQLNTSKSALITVADGRIDRLEIESIRRTVLLDQEIADNALDIAAAEVCKNSDLYPLALKISFTIKQTMIGRSFKTVKLQILCGYPASKHKSAKTVDLVEKTIKTTTWHYSFLFKHDCDYEKYEKNSNDCYAIDWPKKSSGEGGIGVAVSPRGCSGGPYWFLPDQFNLENRFLAGVFIEYYRNDGVAFITRIEKVIELIEGRLQWVQSRTIHTLNKTLN